MTKSERDEHLSKYFSEETLKALDDAVKNVLYDDFANSQLKLLSGQSPEYIAQQANVNMAAELERRMSHIQPEEYEQLKPWYLSIAKSIHEIICSKCGALLGIEIDTKDETVNTHHVEGKFVVAIGDKMFAYRPRTDGVMGYQCGNYIETKYKKEWDKYNPIHEKELAQHEQFLKEYQDALAKFDKLPLKDRNSKNRPEQQTVVFTEEPKGPAYEFCGNDTRVAKIEEDNISEEHLMTSLTNDDIVKVKQEMNATGYEPDVKKTKRGYKIESFELREVKS